MKHLNTSIPFPPSRIPGGNDLFPGTLKALLGLGLSRSRPKRSQSDPGTSNPLICMRFPVPGISLL
jgi:hypothetical protein